MKRLILICVLLTAALPAPYAQAQENRYSTYHNTDTIRTPLDYMMDDGKMTEDEMIMEAQDMFRLCDENPYQRRLFKCECLAGAFLQQREKLGPSIEQYDLYKRITNSRHAKSSCANTEEIAGETFKSCMSFASNYSRTEFNPDNQDFCTCAANKVARDFTKTPRLSTSYVQNLRTLALTACRSPSERKRIEAEALREEREAQERQAKQTQKDDILPNLGKAVN